jgi:hypothetical protein
MGKVMKGRLFERLVAKMLNNFSAHRTVSCRQLKVLENDTFSARRIMVEFLKNEVLAAALYLWSITIMYSQVSQASSNYVNPSHPCIDCLQKVFSRP